MEGTTQHAGTHKAKRKPVTRLVVKKPLRRSSVYNKLPPSVPNAKIAIVDLTSTEGSSESSKEKAVVQHLQNDAISIVDSTLSESSFQELGLNNKKIKKTVRKTLTSRNLSPATSESSKGISNQAASPSKESKSNNGSKLSSNSDTGNAKTNDIPADDLAINLVRNNYLSETKFESIQNWIKNVSTEEIDYQDDIPEALMKHATDDCCGTNKSDSGKKKGAINSTFVFNSNVVPFDEWMRKEYKLHKGKKNLFNNENFAQKSTECNNIIKSGKFKMPSLENKIFKDISSYENNSKADVKNEYEVNFKDTGAIPKTPGGFGQGHLTKEPSVDDDNNMLFMTPKQEKDYMLFMTPMQDKDYVSSLLDQVYGDSWHKNRDKILTEPKADVRSKPRIHKLNVPRTEKARKKPEVYPNPYLDSEKQKSANLLNELHKKRMEANFKSPYFSRPSLIDDDDSPVHPVLDPKITVGTRRKQTKLIFSDDEIDNSSEDSLPVVRTNKSNEFVEDDRNPDSVPASRKPRSRIINQTSSSSDDDDDFAVKPVQKRSTAKKKLPTSVDKLTRLVDKCNINPPIKRETKKYSFLQSLSKNIPVEACDPSALIFRNTYKKNQHSLAVKLYNIFNDCIFNNALPLEAPLEWNTRLRGTAGYCVMSTRHSRNGEKHRSVTIKLAQKVLDSADRLRDTMVHEMCHAAAFLINHVNDGHGAHWKSWTRKARTVFPELPPVKRCHDYEINYKFTYKCTQCSYQFGRHSKSLNLEKKCCGLCGGRFEVFANCEKQGVKKAEPCTPKRDPVGFAKYVKDNYAIHRSPMVKHADVMRVLSKNYHDEKNANAPN